MMREIRALTMTQQQQGQRGGVSAGSGGGGFLLPSQPGQGLDSRVGFGLASGGAGQWTGGQQAYKGSASSEHKMQGLGSGIGIGGLRGGEEEGMRLNETGMSAHTDMSDDMDVARVEGELSLSIEEEEEDHTGGTSR